MASKSRLLALLRRDYASAGDLYFQKGDIGKAAELYGKAGHFKEAAKLAEQLGNEEMTVSFYVQAGTPLKAGEFLASKGKHREAIPYFEEAEAYWQAAESSLKLEQRIKAAALFEKAGDLERAAECYEKAGKFEAAVRVWDSESERLKKSSNRDTEAGQKRRTVDLRRSRMLAKAGKRREAADILLSLDLMAEAAQLLEQDECFEQAIDAYVEARSWEDAVRLLPQAPDTDKKLQVLIYSRCGRHSEAATLYEELGSTVEAAEAYESAGECAKAAQLWEEVGDSERAAELHYRGKQLSDAARCYVGAKNFSRAAATYIETEDHEAAGECYLKMEELLAAARSFLEAGNREAASGALQEIPQQSEDFGEATLLLVPLLVEEGLYQGARHRLELLPPSSSVGTTTVERLYWEGRVHEALDDQAKAAASYEKAASLKRDYRDLPKRLAGLRDRTQRSEQTALESGATGLLTPQPMASDAAVEDRPSQIQFDPGEILAGRYEIQSEIGRGGMSRVYRAHDQELDEEVAIKTLLSRSGDQMKSEERLLREVQICRKITHANVVRVYDFGRFPGGVFVTMEFLEGSTLDKLIDTREQIALDHVKGLLSQILMGLSEAHGMKVIHRDLKPSNVILTTRRVKIMDFGIAHVEDADTNLTQTGQVIGSPMYMSPEQIQGHDLDPRSDLYSLGILSYALLAGREPFTGKTPTAIALKHLQDPPPRIDEFRTGLPSEWDVFIGRLLAKRPEDRYQSADQVLGVLEKLPI